MKIRVDAGRSAAFLLGPSLLLGCGGVSTLDSSAPGSQPESPGVAASGLVLAKSGTRLSAEAYAAAGALKFRHFQDQTLGAACRFQPDVRGELRCFPLTSTTVIYLDAACSRPAAWTTWNEKLTEGQWVTDAARQACSGQDPARRVFRVGAPTTGYERQESGSVAGVYEVAADGSCAPAFPPAKAVPDVIPLHPQEPDALVKGRLASTDVGAGLSVRQLVAEDGARLNFDVTTSDGSVCSFQEDGSCLPGRLALEGGANLDAQCESIAFYDSEPECGRPPRWGKAQTGQIFELVTPQQVFSKVLVLPTPADYASWQYTCEPTSLPNIYALGRDVTGTFSRASIVALGEGPLRASAFELGSGFARFVLSDRTPATTFRNARGDCLLTQTAEGIERCLDEVPQAHENSYYADASCAQPLYTSSAPSSEVAAVRRHEYDDQQRLRAVFTVKPYEGKVYERVDQACEPVAVLRDEPILTLFENVDLASFTPVQRVQLR